MTPLSKNGGPALRKYWASISRLSVRIPATRKLIVNGTINGQGIIDTDKTTLKSALAFDYGERRIGVAFANRITRTATALKTLPARDGRLAHEDVQSLIDEWQPDTLVIGVPYNLDGSESPMTIRATEFGSRLGTHHGLPINWVDERLTSAEASMMLQEQRRSGEKRRRIRSGDIDALAARLIAESWLRD